MQFVEDCERQLWCHIKHMIRKPVKGTNDKGSRVKFLSYNNASVVPYLKCCQTLREVRISKLLLWLYITLFQIL